MNECAILNQSIVRIILVNIFCLHLETPRDSFCVVDLIYRDVYIELVACTKQATYTGIPQCLMLRKQLHRNLRITT